MSSIGRLWAGERVKEGGVLVIIGYYRRSVQIPPGAAKITDAIFRIFQ